MIRVKICGINREDAFDTALEAGADWIGFVFFPASPRIVTPAQAAALSARHAGGPPRVGLFVDPQDAVIEAALAALKLDILQLYAPPPRIAEIAARFGLPVWRSLAFARPEDLPSQCAPAAALMVEPAPPAGSTRPGGNAVSLDWAMLRPWSPAFPWLLAGGLRPDNVARAIAQSGATAVDVSSGVESAPGRKSPELIRAFVREAKEGRVLS